MKTKYEFLRNEINSTGRRVGRSEHATLEGATEKTGNQITYEESVGVGHGIQG